MFTPSRCLFRFPQHGVRTPRLSSTRGSSRREQHARKRPPARLLAVLDHLPVLRVVELRTVLEVVAPGTRLDRGLAENVLRFLARDVFAARAVAVLTGDVEELGGLLR